MADTRLFRSAFSKSLFWTLFIGKASHDFLFHVAVFIKALDPAKRLHKLIMIAIIKFLSFTKPHTFNDDMKEHYMQINIIP